MTKDQIDQYRVFIAACEACHRSVNPSHSWHVVDWLAQRLPHRFMPIRRQDQIINFSADVC